MSFGGSVKLTGESEYRQAIKNCISSLQSMSTALKNQTTDFNNNDKSIKNSAAAQKQLNETIKTQQAEISKAKSQLASYQVAIQNQTTKHNLLNKEYKAAVTELERIKKASGESSNEYQKQAQVVDKLEKELIDSTEALNESKTAMASLRSEINNSNKTISNAEKALNDLGNEAEDSGKKARDGGDGFTVLKGVLANLSAQAIGAAISGLKKLAGAVVNVGKQAVDSYAEYEQLVGGVETLFKDSADIVQDYAAKAYKTAGVSANKYMEQATSFSASLLQGLGGDTKRAAEVADVAIRDMADNANKMGTSIEMIQNAYQGFAKDNFTMLDNLKLGYGGTAGEMARLINETGVMGKAFKATAKNVKDVPFDKMIEAIHKVQEQMGITGTTSLEASETIQGSVNSMKASWSNLLTAIADDNADLSKSVDEFIDSAITASRNLVPRVKQVVDGIKKSLNSLVTEVFPKLKKEIPELAPIIDIFNWFVKNKSLVVGAVTAMVGAFAINKILSFSKGMSDVTKAIIDAAKGTAIATTATNINTAAEAANTTGKVAATGATGALTVATNLLNAAWKANPIGIVIAGVSALIGVLAAVKNKTDEATKAEREQAKALEEAAKKAKEANEAYDDLRETQQKQINAGMTEISHYESLYDELQSIVDQNGKVKKGYEERASFITSTLAEALGIEIKNVDGVIQKYGDLKSTIDEVMEKKKAQILLDSQESLYKEAIQGQTEAIREMNKAQDELKTKKQEQSDLNDILVEKEKLLDDAKKHFNNNAMWMYSDEVAKIKEKIKAKDEEVNNAQTAYDTQRDLLSKYAYDIGIYESNMAAAHAGEYEKMSNVNWEYVKDYQATGDAQKAQLEDQVKITETNLNLLKELKEKSGSDIYDQQIKDNEKLLKEQQDSLKKYNSATEDALYDNQKSWLDNASDVITKLTGKKTEFKDVGNGQVQWYEDGIAVGKPMATAEAEKVAKDTLEEFNKKLEAEGAGKDLLRGFINGESNSYIQESAFKTARSFAGTILSNIKKKLGIASPSKEGKKIGAFLIEGLGLGMEKEEGSVLKQVNGFGKSIISSLNSGLSGAINTSAISDIANSLPNVFNVNGAANSYGSDNTINIVEQFKEALAQMTIELDDENMGKFVDKTVARTIYS
jgi:myosin heavy subunit